MHTHTHNLKQSVKNTVESNKRSHLLWPRASATCMNTHTHHIHTQHTHTIKGWSILVERVGDSHCYEVIASNHLPDITAVLAGDSFMHIRTGPSSINFLSAHIANFWLQSSNALFSTQILSPWWWKPEANQRSTMWGHPTVLFTPSISWVFSAWCMLTTLSLFLSDSVFLSLSFVSLKWHFF